MHGRSGDFGRPTIDRLGAHGKPHVRAAQVSTRRAKQGRCCNNRPETPYDFDQIYDSNGFFFESNPPPPTGGPPYGLAARFDAEFFTELSTGGSNAPRRGGRRMRRPRDLRAARRAR
ncbi:hypothetical protein C7S16_2690 [Burkholderia thailandensis]|uniref:Uncharacterized protein n=1 Tax=Burkholderia thailandensis TaxID=57975 RepID=A0AAW9CZE1_BURTH|nr:hypothetical protein [Burkholderia thailandensis]